MDLTFVAKKLDVNIFGPYVSNHKESAVKSCKKNPEFNCG